MKIDAVKTPKIVAGGSDIFAVLDEALPKLEEGSVIAVTSKIVSICEGSIVPFGETTKEELIKQQAERWLPGELSKYGYHFTIIQNTIIAAAGIDESNGGDYYILWPKDSQKTANEIRKHLSEKHGVRDIGVIITDSTSFPMRRGTIGVALAHSGFDALKNYIGQPDIFGRPFGFTQANISGGLASASVLAMGEGAEQTPIAVISDVPFVQFRQADPPPEELAEINIVLEDDLFAPFFTSQDWKTGTNP